MKIKVTVYGDSPTPAQNQPLTNESVSTQIRKLGNTIFRADHIHIDLEDGIYLNKSSLNSIKNQAAESLQKEIITNFKRPFFQIELTDNIKENFEEKRSFSVCLRTIDQFKITVQSPVVSIIYLEMNNAYLLKMDDLI